MKFRGVDTDSTIKCIGSLFRRIDGSGWRVNIKLTPSQNKRHMSVSQLPVLARRRIINPTEQRRSAGFQLIANIVDTSAWKVASIRSCPIIAVRKQTDADQLCFVFEHKGVTYYLPQLELARVLFFHHAYLARLALVNQGLTQEFDAQRRDDEGNPIVAILPNSSLPLFARKDEAYRRMLGWILLDADARRSFESINNYQLLNGHDKGRYRTWHFQFDPPLLEGVKLTCRGHYDPEIMAFFIYEVHAVAGLRCDCPEHVAFYDPRYVDGAATGASMVSPRPASASDMAIDDEQVPDVDQAEVRVETEAVAFEFSNPFRTSRIGNGKKGARVHEKDADDACDSSEPTGRLVSADEASVQGSLPSADYAGLIDNSDDGHLYANRFVAFDSMVQCLSRFPGCQHHQHVIQKLPMVKGFSKHLLADGNPRCMSCHFLSKGKVVYVLLEVDTSDNSKALSTVLLRQQMTLAAWRQRLLEIPELLIRCSLTWPSSFLEKTFDGAFTRISHPHASSMKNSTGDRGYERQWAERIYVNILTSCL